MNWRHAPKSGDYPNYENVEATFWREFETYKTFVDGIGQAKLGVVSRCELTYVNLISPSAFFSAPADLARVLPGLRGFTDPQSEQRRLVGLNASATYQLDENLFIDSFARLGKRNDTKELVAVLELRAYGAPSDVSLEGCDKWFKAAHDGTYNLFLTVTDKEVQRKRVEASMKYPSYTTPLTEQNVVAAYSLLSTLSVADEQSGPVSKLHAIPAGPCRLEICTHSCR